jgi:hypothetical protein
MGVRTHNLNSNVLKYDFDNVDEAMFHDVERPCEIIFCIMGIEKNVLDEIVKLMF